VYISFLFRPNPGFGTTGGLAFGTWENGIVVGARPTGVYGLMTPPDTASSDSGIAVVQGETAFLVAKVQKNDDSTITWFLYVNPTVGDPEPAQDAASLTIPGSDLPPAVFIYNDGGYSTDEIRLGAAWADVLPPEQVIGDITGDGVVDIDDLFEVIGAWGACDTPPPPCAADLDGNGFVDIDDLFMVLSNWT
jgi:hypothetical protein